MSPAVVWFRQDLRLADNPALQAACESGGAVYPLFIWAPQEEGEWAPASASRYWLHHSLASLDAALRGLGSQLTIRTGPSLSTIMAFAREVGAERVLWNRRYEPAAVERDGGIKRALADAGIEAASFKAALLFEPHEVRTNAGEPFKVFTPFWRQCMKQPEPEAPTPAPCRIPPPAAWPSSMPLAQLELLPRIDWAGGIGRHWRIGEAGAQAALREFVDDGVDEYAQRRDRPDVRGVSGMSPYLHFGEVSPRQIWAAVCARERAAGRMSISAAAAGYLRQLGWREFAHHLLFHFRDTPTQPLRKEFTAFPWIEDARLLKCWERGRTGYPIVDAGMRELWTTGWMHNRVRMIVASFLVKDLLIHWLYGARWFWDTLVDADLANNTLGWQWTAGCGADAAPYFRIFNPVSQAERFDPDGRYVRQWVPELARVPGRHVHAPWRAPDEVLAAAAVRLGTDYPRPVVEHDAARQRALDAWQQIRSKRR
jgi:deoxyribodipyrimidine photo-lyase